jgi:hypothetical protein
MSEERWPTTYDAKELASTIQKLSANNQLASTFYSSTALGYSCQGDIVELNSAQPYIAKDGKPAIIDDFKYWLVIGNSCDLSRKESEVRYTQIIPIVHVNSDDFLRSKISDFLAYKYSRRFYLPPWRGADKSKLFFADFTRATTIEKSFLSKELTRASLLQHSWYLLHCCLVRYLARDDGRSS